MSDNKSLTATEVATIIQELFECHITIDPVIVQENLDKLTVICEPYKFRLAKLYMLKDNLASQRDTFMTGHGNSMIDLSTRMLNLIGALKLLGFKVRRYKIEKIVIDSRFDDCYEILTDDELKATKE